MAHTEKFSVKLGRNDSAPRLDVDGEELHRLLEHGLVEICPPSGGMDIGSPEPRRKILEFLGARPWERGQIAERTEDDEGGKTREMAELSPEEQRDLDRTIAPAAVRSSSDPYHSQAGTRPVRDDPQA